MEVVLGCWIALMAVAALVWLSRHRSISHGQTRVDQLSAETEYPQADAQPLVSVILAAKDESSNIDVCLQSLAHQQYAPLEIWAVNDRSSDDTGHRIDRWADKDPRISALHIQELPDGWFGKSHAVHQAAGQATGDWLLFTDADCRFLTPRAVEGALRYAQSHAVDFLSVLPNHRHQGFWERVLQPACSAILMIWFNPVKVNDPADPAAYANGAFMLVKHDCYQAIGGHASVRDQATEDMRLAQQAKQQGYHLRIAGNGNLYEVRMYESVSQIIRGWTRIFAGSLDGIRPLFRALRVLIIFGVMPIISLLVATAWISQADPSASYVQILAGVSGFALLAEWSVMTRFYAMSRCAWWYGLLYPMAAIVGVGILIRAISYALGWSRLNWRGTNYVKS